MREKGDIGYYQRHGTWYRVKILLIHEQPPALTVIDGHGEFVIKYDEFTPKAEHLLRIAEEEFQQAKIRLRPYIDAYNAGFKTLKEMSAHLNKPPISVLSPFREALRRGLIGYPETNG